MIGILAGTARYVRNFILENEPLRPDHEDFDLIGVITDVKLSPVFLNIIEYHFYQCFKCDPKLHKQLTFDAKRKAKDNYETKLKRKIRDDLYVIFKVKHQAEMKNYVKKSMINSIRTKIILKEIEIMKNELAKEVSADFKVKLRAELRVEMKVEYEQKFKAFLSDIGS